MSSTKTCTKCGDEKSLDDFSLMKRGKFGRNSQCKDCRNVIQKTYRDAAKVPSKTAVITRTIKPKYVDVLNTLSKQLAENYEIEKRYPFGAPPRDQLAHQPEDIFPNVELVTKLTEMYRIEYKATDTNSLFLSDIRKSQENEIKNKIAMKVSQMTGSIVNMNTIDILFYPALLIKSLPKKYSHVSTGPACLVVINDVDLNTQQISDLRAVASG